MGDVEILARDPHAGIDIVGRHAEAFRQFFAERGRGVLQQHAVLRSLRSGNARQHGAEVEFERVGEHRIGRAGVAPHPLRTHVGFDQRDTVGVAPGEMQIVQRDLIDREEAAGGAIFRGHVGDGGAVGQRQIIEAGTEEFDEFADHAAPAQHLRHGQHEIGRGGALRHAPNQAEADDVGDQHGDRLAKHRGLGLDAADAPAENSESVDHRGMAIGAIKRVRIGENLAVILRGPDALAEIFQIYLMADAGAGGHDTEIVECLLAPAQEGVALAVALELDVDVGGERLGGAEGIDHDGVINDEVDRDQRVDLLRLATEAKNTVPHRGEVDHAGHAGEILHQDSGRLERHLGGGAGAGQPAGDRLRIGDAIGFAVLEPQHVFEQNLQAHRQAGHVANRALGGRDGEIFVILPLDA